MLFQWGTFTLVPVSAFSQATHFSLHLCSYIGLISGLRFHVAQLLKVVATYLPLPLEPLLSCSVLTTSVHCTSCTRISFSIWTDTFYLRKLIRNLKKKKIYTWTAFFFFILENQTKELFKNPLAHQSWMALGPKIFWFTFDSLLLLCTTGDFSIVKIKK